MLLSQSVVHNRLPISAAYPRNFHPSPTHTVLSHTSTQAHHSAQLRALFDPRDILPETLADDDEELITDPLAERLAAIDDDLLQAEADHLRSQLALEQERSDVLSQQLADAERDLRAATARLNTRSVLDEAEDVMGAPDASGKQFAAAAADARRAERTDKWAVWAAANPDEAADLAAEAGWELDDLPDEVADLYEQIREAGARLPGGARGKGRSGTKQAAISDRRHSGTVELLAAVHDTSPDTSPSTSDDDTSEDDTSSDDEAALADAAFDTIL